MFLPSDWIVDLSRFQFAMTALYHFLFVPLTLGLSMMLAIMESVYVMTNRPIWREMTKFWGILFGINFALGVATGITMEFQFGMNWSYYAHYVGDIFGAPLAIEGLMAFFLEATFVGLFFFGWDKMSKPAHLAVTWLMALGTNLSALWILIANGWMQNPVGSMFNAASMRMEITDFAALLFNPVAQAKFVHTVSAGYVTGAMFVLSISAYYMLQGKHIALAKRSMTIAVSFGLASALSVVVLGDESGYLTSQHQRIKLAAMESMWKTETPPASFTLFGIPDQENRQTRYALKVPYIMGLIGTRSFDKPILGIEDLVEMSKPNIRKGMLAFDALTTLQKDPTNKSAQKTLDTYNHYLGYGMLLLPYTDQPLNATDEQIDKAAWSLVPEVAPLFWGFRIMVACGVFFIFLFAAGFYLSCRRKLDTRWFLKLALFSLPLPWIAIEAGWFIAEYGRQPWVIEGMLPTFIGVSSLTSKQLLFSLFGFAAVYTALAIVEIKIMLRAIKRGPAIQGEDHAH